jgi:hypothetical protein
MIGLQPEDLWSSMGIHVGLSHETVVGLIPDFWWT